MTKLILTDADGVLFDWVTGFNKWATETMGLKLRPDFQNFYTIEKWFGLTENEANEIVSEYNNTDMIAELPPWLDAVKYVNILHDEHDFKFVVITAMGDTARNRELRWKSLQRTFGDVFIDLHITDLRQCKLKFLEQYQSAIWIEDKPSNAETGLAAGHRTFLMAHSHNSDIPTKIGITRVKDWKEMYNIIIAEEQGTMEIPIYNFDST